MTVLSAQLHLYSHDARPSTVNYEKSGADRSGNGPEAGRNMPAVTPSPAIQASLAVVPGLDTGVLVSAGPDFREAGLISGTDRGRAYADATELVGDNAHLAAVMHHSEAEYSLNP